MYVSQFQVGNYKCFDQSAPLEFAPGFNIITGQNNAGKTALIEALSLTFTGNPHRSLKTVPAPDIPPNPTSWVTVAFTLTKDELFELLRSGGRRQYQIPMPANDDPMALNAGMANASQGFDRFVEAVFSPNIFTFMLRQEQQGSQPGQLKCGRVPSFGLYKAAQPQPSQGRVFFSIEIESNGSVRYVANTAASDDSEIGVGLGHILRSHVYRFSAERFNVGSYTFGNKDALLPNASNLPEVLNALQANVAKFNRFNQLVSEIFPQVQKVSVRPSPSGNNMVDILVWTIDPELGRVDLARPLSESGTGIGQVLAILYVALTAIRPQVVIVDEPQSFLHPGAIRKLIEVLKVQSKHQFIIATHSPTVITSANPTTISLVRSKSGQSEIEHIDVKKTKTMATYLNEIGARLSDVFGADNVLWAEGATEELCFPIILEKIAKKPLMGTAILGVRQVGDLEGRDAERVFDIYSRLSQGTSLLPPAIGFLFDAESRTKAQQTDLRRKSRNQVDFLPRRMFENFLLVPEAIAAVTNTIDGFRSTPVRVEEIREFIQTKLKDRTYVDPLGNGSGEAGDWTTRIDGARVLSEMFTSLSETRVTYRKTEHSVALVEWIVENKPEALQEIADILVRLLDTKTTRG